jgi:hypothetical protein
MRQCGRRHADGGMWVWHVGWTPRFPARRGPNGAPGGPATIRLRCKCKIRPERMWGTFDICVTFYVSWACGLARALMLVRALMALSEHLGATAGPPAISSTGVARSGARGANPAYAVQTYLARQPLLVCCLASGRSRCLRCPKLNAPGR